MPKAYRLRAAELDILHHLNRYHFLTARQVTRLLSQKGTEATLSKAQEKLKDLAKHGYLQREAIAKRHGEGKGEFVYSLDTPGRQVLERRGEEVRRRFRPSEEKEHDTDYLQHTLRLNDVLIAAEILARLRPEEVRLDDMRHEREMKRRYRVTIASEGGIKRPFFEPDGWLDIAMLKRRVRWCLLVEYDNATQMQKKWRRKIAAFLSFVTPDTSGKSPYQTAFGRTTFVLVVVTSGDEGRRNALAAWTMAEFTVQRREDLAGRCFFTTARAHTLSPTAFFGGSHWYQTESEEPGELLRLEEGSA